VLIHYVEQAQGQRDWKAVRRIAVDETSAHRGHRYATNVLDCDGAGLLFMVEGRSSQALGSFAQALREHGGDPRQIQAIAMDMSPAYLKGASEHFPQAQIVFDKFHVMLLVGQALEAVRRQLRHDGAELKGSLWSLRGNAWNLSTERVDLEQLRRDRIEEVLGICAAGGDSHREVAVMSEYVEADYHGRFLVELLQNANDQAIKAGNRDSTVTLVGTSSFFAAANEGEPFDDPGLKSVTSLGLSPKDPKQLIGNKGIGFKSVYQISRNPEIYSAGRPGGSFRDPDSNRFRMPLTLFQTDAEVELLRNTCRSVLLESRERAAKLQQRVKADPLAHLLNEVKCGAPFKFPQAIPKMEAARRFKELGELPETAQTLVVLPLIDSERIKSIISCAIEEILDGQGAAILFLPGVGRFTHL
jgi:Transposase